MSDKEQLKIFFTNSVSEMYEKVEKGKETRENYVEWSNKIHEILLDLEFKHREILYLFEKGESVVRRQLHSLGYFVNRLS